MEPARPLVPAHADLRVASGVWTLVENALAGLKPATRRAYGEDLAAFAAWTGAPDVATACSRFTALPHGDANALAFEYRSLLVRRKLSPSTVNRAMAAIKFVTRMARLGGRIAWELEIPSIRVETYRDTLGPGRSSVADVVRELEAQDGALAARNLAIIGLLFNQGLRRGEVAALDLGHLDPEHGRLSILGKGRSGREWVTLARGTCEYLDRWLARRGMSPGPLFVGLDRASKGGRLSDTSIYRMIRGYGLGRPHGLRHSAITAALEATNGNIAEVMKFSRHKDPKVLMRYDDNRKDVAGDIAARIDLGRRPTGRQDS